VLTLTGRLFSAVGLMLWITWLVWRASQLLSDSAPPADFLASVAVLILEIVALTSTLLVTIAFWRSPDCTAGPSGEPSRHDDGPLPARVARRLGLDSGTPASSAPDADPVDGTGAWAWAHSATTILHPRSFLRRSSAERAWAVIATDGIRRSAMVVVLVVLLFTGVEPVALPSAAIGALLIAGVMAMSLGVACLSGNTVPVGSRLVWSMESLGAGLGSGVSRTGLPVRWVTTIATMVVLNLSVALRGLSDRWTHGLSAMDHDLRTITMIAATLLVIVGHRALRRLPAPDIEFYGATQRLEEWSTRRLALGATSALALIGLLAGSLPAATW
jgi:hypothetical protein